MIDRPAWRSIRAFSKVAIATNVDLEVEGLDLVPTGGPVILAARHYHHLYDGCAILATIPRQVQVLVGLDWIERAVALRAMQAACRSAGWPVVFRDSNSGDRENQVSVLRRAMIKSRAILRQGNILLVFPEGFPTIDPRGSRKAGADEFLPFHAGFARIALDAWRDEIPAVVVPVGFQYSRGTKWHVRLRFGGPVERDPAMSASALTALIERQVIALSC